MSNTRATLLVLLALAAGGVLVRSYVAGRGERAAEAEQDETLAAPSRVTPGKGEPMITLSAGERTKSGIEIAALKSVRYQPTAPGYGTVLDLRPLADLANSFAGAKADLQVAQARLAASKAGYERAKSLYKDARNVSAAQLQAAQAEFAADQAKSAAARTRLATLTTTATQAWGSVLGRAVADGAPLLARLLDRQDFLVQLTAPPGVRFGAPPASAALERAGQPPARLSLVSPAPRTDPRIQGESFFYLARAQTGLKPGMDVVARLANGTALHGFAAPASAIVWFDGRAWIYLQTGAETFVRRPIAMDKRTADGDVFVGALPASAQAVVKGGQLLLSEELRAGIKMEEQ